MIDARDERHTTVYLSAELGPADARPVARDIGAELYEVGLRRRRRELAPVAELTGDESFLEDIAQTGTDGGASEIVARQRRLTFGVVPDP